jgi:hypothetical protein
MGVDEADVLGLGVPDGEGGECSECVHIVKVCAGRGE